MVVEESYMEMDFIRNRITELRVKKGVSEYQLSYDLGHSKNYIHNIVTGYSQPSVKELLYLIDTLGITPRLFFDEEAEYRNPIFSSGDYRWHQVDERSRFRSCSADGQALE